MHVICSRAMLFTEFPRDRKPDSPHILKNARKFTLAASKDAQPVPDWLLELDSFKRAAAAKVIRRVQFVDDDTDGDSVKVVASKSASEDKKPAADDSKDDKKPDTDKSNGKSGK